MFEKQALSCCSIMRSGKVPLIFQLYDSEKSVNLLSRSAQALAISVGSVPESIPPIVSL